MVVMTPWSVRGSVVAAFVILSSGCGSGSPIIDPGAAAGSGAAGVAAAGGAGGTAGAGLGNGGAGDVPADAGASSATLPDGGCVGNAFRHDGVCECQPTTPVVCGAACTDVSLDDENCGACGHACAPTATCNGGVCGASVTNVVPAAPGCGALHLALADATLYWTDTGHGLVSSQALGGGPSATIAQNEASPGLIVLGAGRLFWVDIASSAPVTTDTGFVATSTTATIRVAALPHGTPTTLATETNLNGGVMGLALSDDGQTLYYSADTKVRAVPVGGGAAMDVGSEEKGGVPTGLAVAGDQIAFVTALNATLDVITVAPGTLARCDIPDPTGMAIAPIMVNCARIGGCHPDTLFDAIFFHDTNVFVTGDDGINVGHQVPDGQDQVAATVGGNEVTGMVGGGLAQIYFGEGDDIRDDGLVEETPYAPQSTAVAIARGQQAPRSFVLGAGRVFWASDCAINSAPQ